MWLYSSKKGELTDDSIKYMYQKTLAEEAESNQTIESDGVKEGWIKIKSNLSSEKEIPGERRMNKNRK